MDHRTKCDPCIAQRNPWIAQIHALRVTYTCRTLKETTNKSRDALTGNLSNALPHFLNQEPRALIFSLIPDLIFDFSVKANLFRFAVQQIILQANENIENVCSSWRCVRCSTVIEEKSVVQKIPNVKRLRKS